MSSAVIQIFLLTVVTLCASAEMEKIEFFNITIPERCRQLIYKKEGSTYCTEEPNEYSSKKKLMHGYTQEMEKQGISFKQENQAFKEDVCDGDDNRNCCTSSAAETPTFVYSESVIKLVLQTLNFRQTIKRTKCKQTGVQCFEDFEIKNSTECRTDYGTSKLYVYNPFNNKTEHVTVTYPVSCSCHVYQRSK